jgi:hypothetical protein
MKKLVVCVAAAAVVSLLAARADAKLVALYASGQGGLQNTGDTGPQGGFEVGARAFIFDGYVDYMAFGSGKSVSRAIIGLRGGVGLSVFRFVLRGGVGAIREDNSALTMPVGTNLTVSRTGGVARAGAAVEGRVAPFTWLGLGVDGEEFGFLTSDPGFTKHGSDVLGTLKLTFEIGI